MVNLLIDWNNKKKIAVFSLGLVAFVGSLAVLGATVLRVQNLQKTINLPKAAESAECTSIPSCCSGVGAGNGYDYCYDNGAGWGDLRWCTQEQCDGSAATACNSDLSGCSICQSDDSTLCGGKSRGECAKPRCACGAARVEFCASSQCGTSQTYCSGACVDTRSDAKNCASCGHACDPGQICSYSKCETHAKSCNISLSSTSVKPGEPVTATWTGMVSSGWDVGGIWLSKQNQSSGQTTTTEITPVPSPLSAGNYNYGNGIWQYPVRGDCYTNNGSCTVALNPSGIPLPEGKYNVFCHVGGLAADGSNPYNSCSGQPLCTYASGGVNCGNWKDCGSASRTVLTVAAATQTCTTGQTLCGTTCVDLKTNATNCGACGTACITSQTCTNGVCVTPATTCTTGQTLCGTTCCNNATQTCTSGVCTTNTTTNEANSCWGNLGASGKCYDCDGNGVVNALDFSCFRKRYGNTISS